MLQALSSNTSAVLRDFVLHLWEDNEIYVQLHPFKSIIRRNAATLLTRARIFSDNCGACEITAPDLYLCFIYNGMLFGSPTGVDNLEFRGIEAEKYCNFHSCFILEYGFVFVTYITHFILYYY